MLFTPNEELEDTAESKNTAETHNELINEIGEIGSDFAAAVMQLENIADAFKTVTYKQEELLDKVDKMVKANALAVNPNPKMLDAMKMTNHSLDDFREVLVQLKLETEKLKESQIKEAVRKELEQLVIRNISEINE